MRALSLASLLSFPLLVSCAAAQAAAPVPDITPPRAYAGVPAQVGVAPAPGKLLIQGDRLMDSVRWLADDEREGRMTGTRYERDAARWIAGRFEEAGLEPAGDEGKWFQTFEATVGVSLGIGNEFSVSGVAAIGDLDLGRDWNPFGFSESGTIEDGEIVFVGYGITDPDIGYDDYAGLDVEDKIVLMLRHEPQQDDPLSPFNGRSWSRHAVFRTKAMNAFDHGAAGMLLFTGPLSESYRDDPLLRLGGDEGIGGADLLAAHIKHEIGEALLTVNGIDVREWMEAVDEDLEPRSVPLDSRIRASLTVTVEKDRRLALNVVGKLPGADIPDEAVLLGAHYDHLGRGNSSSLAPESIGEIHNGADDNASGTAALVELARVFGITGPLSRTVIFAAFSGEEIGLLGSAHLASHPPVPLENVQAMVNMDMVGRPQDNSLTIGGVGTSPSFGDMVERWDEASPLELSTSQSSTAGSDHMSFYVKEVPVLFLFSGLHEDYHKPSDDAERIDAGGITEATRLVHDIVRELANRPDRLEFARADDIGPPSGDAPSSGRGSGPYLGTISDFGNFEGGVKLAGVREGSPAAEAGIRAGDIVVRFENRDISDLYDYTCALREHQPGDTVTIVVLRDGEEVTVTPTLGRRE